MRVKLQYGHYMFYTLSAMAHPENRDRSGKIKAVKIDTLGKNRNKKQASTKNKYKFFHENWILAYKLL